MDTLRRRVSRLLILTFAAGCFPSLSHASEAPYATALASCKAYEDAYAAGNTITSPCGPVQSDLTRAGAVAFYYSSRSGGPSYESRLWYFELGSQPVENPCTDLPPATFFVPGKVLAGSSSCQSVLTSSGGNVSCARTFSPSPGGPTLNPYSGKWQTYGTVTSSGNLCNGDGAWKDGTGVAITPAPPVPTVETTDVTPPKLCGGGSCYDPATDQYCASSGGQSVCVSGAAGRSSAGACSSGSGGAVVCSGSPSARRPDPAVIPDPATQIVSSDKTTQADPTTGAAQSVTTNVYNQAPGQSDSGKTSSDQGPAPASSAPGSDNGSYAGGGDCDTPPVCAGDAAVCGAARTQWSTTCTVHKDLTGDGPPSDLEALKTKYSQGDVWQDDSTSTDNSDGGKANRGEYNNAGFGYADQCPMKDMEVPLWKGQVLSIGVSKLCVIGPWIRGLMIGFALFSAAIITRGGKP